jgi:dsRNA-specific ribonuclease
LHPIRLHADQVRRVQELLGYTFQEPLLLSYAVMRSSTYDDSGLASFERLEFLGDAVVDYLITIFLMHKFPRDTPHMLTRRRQRLVSNHRFAKILNGMGLVRIVMQNQLSRADASVYSQHLVDSSTHGCIFEALVGAVFVDCRCDLDVTWSIFGGLLIDKGKPDALLPL